MKVGDYVITKDRLHIGKIYNINDFREPSMRYAIDFPKQDDFIFMGEDDFKSSPNIIDLIEVGDYVNETKVTMIAGTRYDDKDLHCYCDYCENKETRKWLMIPAKDIKSIVTKEQFSQMEYKIKEK